MQKFLYFALLLGTVECARVHKGALQDALESVTKSIATDGAEQQAPTTKRIETRSDIPSVEETAQGKLFYLEAGINAGVDQDGEKIDTAKFNYYHSGIGLEFPNGATKWYGKIAIATRKSFSIEWYATKGLGKALLPGADLKFDSATQMDVTDSITSYWTKRTHVADITGRVWNKFRNYVLAYAQAMIDKRMGYYQTWRVESPKGKVLLRDFVCDSFSQAALWKLIKLGAKRLPGVDVKRNYVKLFAEEEPTQVNMKDPKQVAELVKFWQEIAKLKANSGSGLNPATIQKDVALIFSAQAMAGSAPHAFVGSPAIGWRRVAIVSPYSQSGYSEMRLPK